MVALTADRNTPRREGDEFNDPVAAATTIFAGALVCLDAAGNAVNGATATTLRSRGVALEAVSNPGAAGAARVRCRPGLYKFLNSAAADQITRADIGANAFIVTNSQVARTNGTNTRSVAGKIEQIDADGGVWVWVGISN